MSKKNFRDAVKKAGNMLWRSFPLVFGTVLLISLITILIPNGFYIKVFTGNIWFDSFLGSLVGSISAGNPIISYILGGEFLKEGISLIAVTAFLVSWVTVGIIQLPAESYLLGKRFALIRNLLSFISAIIVAILTVIILEVFL
jgi:uncharacterized membrane protein YraQ (UPF0718 family)